MWSSAVVTYLSLDSKYILRYFSVHHRLQKKKSGHLIYRRLPDIWPFSSNILYCISNCRTPAHLNYQGVPIKVM